MKTKRLLNRKVQLSFGCSILSLLVMGAIAYRGMAVSAESDRWVRHTHEVLASLQDLRFAMNSVETSYRGFLLTNNESYIESYHADIASAKGEEATVLKLTVDNPVQQRRLREIEILTVEEVQFAEMVISLRQAKGLAAAADAIRDRRDQRLMDQFQSLIHAMQDEEQRLLVPRDADAKRRLRQTKTVLYLGTALGFLIALGVGWSIQHDDSELGRAEEALHNSEEKYRMLLSNDLIESKKSEMRLVKTVAELKRSNDELQQFAYVSSHDLQEPLRMVASFTQLLAGRYKGRLDSDADEFIAFAVDGCNRMQALIQDLLAYSRAGANGKSRLEVSSEETLNESLAILRIMIEKSGAVVTHDPLPALTTDEAQLTQVFQNLVGNAVKYRSAEVPRVHVSAEKGDGNEWVFSVRDNGLGIEPQYFEKIFILFQRLHGRDEFEGTGIGLAVCKKILERLGGRIWVESEPEKGSTFYFALPGIEGK
jgi:signal transduction histidine kinase